MNVRATVFAATLVALAAATSLCAAQESPSPVASHAPQPSAPQTAMEREYDGTTHVTLAPYVWLPTVRQNVQYTIPTLAQPGGITVQKTVNIGPTDYVGSLNSAAMLAFDVRRGALDVFGDYVYTNLSAGTTVTKTVVLQNGTVQIPVTVDTSARLASSLPELAVGVSLAHDRYADLNAFIGWRAAPLNVSLDYTVTTVPGLFNPSGHVTQSVSPSDVIVGVRGKAYFENDRWFATYYVDVGSGSLASTHQIVFGIGRRTDRGQALVLTYRALGYDGFPATSPVQKLTMSGPLLGYTFSP